MQAVILAAGRGTRMKELTESTPKPMLKIGGKTLLEHKLEALPQAVDEVILVVSYLGGVIHDYFGGIYNDKHLLYVEQDNPTGGTADALWQAKPLLKDTFLVMNGDNIYAPEDMDACIKFDWAVLVQQRDTVRTGAVIADKAGRVIRIDENTNHSGERGYANTGLYVLDERIFDYAPVPKAPGSQELGLPQTMIQAAKEIYIHAVPATYWLEIKEPDDIKKAEEFLAERAT